MLRTLIIFIIIYLLLKVVKNLFLTAVSGTQRMRTAAATGRGVITDEMVQDPVCEVYLPKRSALTCTDSGQVYFFCSKECMKKFKEGKA